MMGRAPVHWILILLCGLLLTGCLPAAPAVSSPLPTRTPVSTAQPTPEILAPTGSPSIPAPTRQPAPSVNTRYQIDASLDESLRSLTVREEIYLMNPTGAAMDGLPLAVEANLYTNAFELLKVSVSNGIEIREKTLELNRLDLRFQPALAAGESLTISLEYSLSLPPIHSDKPQVFGYTQKQINLADWYPFLPAYAPGEGWRIHPPAPVGEHTVYPAADFDVQLNLPQLSPALVVAASAPAEVFPGGYHYHIEAARNFTWSASQEYRVRTGQAGSVTVTSYAYPATELQAGAALEYTVQAINYFSKQFALPLPHTSLSIVQADFPDGMEFDGLYFLSQRFYYGFDGSPRSYLALIAVHETAHQWWYARVGSDQALEPWLDEALCTYSELLFYENLNPELADWWWKFRVEPNHPAGDLTKTIYDFSDFLTYRNSIYLGGVQFLQAIRQEIGDPAFFAGLQTYAQAESNQIASRRDLLDAFEKSTRNDLTDLEKTFFQP